MSNAFEDLLKDLDLPVKEAEVNAPPTNTIATDTPAAPTKTSIDALVDKIMAGTTPVVAAAGVGTTPPDPQASVKTISDALIKSNVAQTAQDAQAIAQTMVDASAASPNTASLKSAELGLEKLGELAGLCLIDRFTK